MPNSLHYPVGEFTPSDNSTSTDLEKQIEIIREFPQQLKLELAKLDKAHLDTPYRPEGWTVRQVIHHCADSHMNSFIRFKLALTEDNPTIKPYKEALWAEGSDYLSMAISPSIQILEGLHARWTKLLRSLTAIELKRTFHHPENKQSMSLQTAIELYAWHCLHHLGHVKIVSGG